jgi:hypothetical protein
VLTINKGIVLREQERICCPGPGLMVITRIVLVGA